MTFYYQRQCEDSCCSPCSPVFISRSSECGSPCVSQSAAGLCGYRGWSRDCCPAFSARYCSPYSSCYTQRYSYRSYNPCYPC